MFHKLLTSTHGFLINNKKNIFRTILLSEKQKLQIQMVQADNTSCNGLCVRQ